MSIKNLKPTNNSGFVQGYFNPKNPEKYIGPTLLFIDHHGKESL
jgi:hypothetical protein